MQKANLIIIIFDFLEENTGCSGFGVFDMWPVTGEDPEGKTTKSGVHRQLPSTLPYCPSKGDIFSTFYKYIQQNIL